MADNVIASWIRGSRKARSWNQTQVGLRLGVSQGRVSQWETGQHAPTAEELRKLGLGKTIEAGLIARELLLRKKCKTIVVAVPPSVLDPYRFSRGVKVRKAALDEVMENVRSL